MKKQLSNKTYISTVGDFAYTRKDDILDKMVSLKVEHTSCVVMCNQLHINMWNQESDETCNVCLYNYILPIPTRQILLGQNNGKSSLTLVLTGLGCRQNSFTVSVKYAHHSFVDFPVQRATWTMNKRYTQAEIFFPHNDGFYGLSVKGEGNITQCYIKINHGEQLIETMEQNKILDGEIDLFKMFDMYVEEYDEEIYDLVYFNDEYIKALSGKNMNATMYINGFHYNIIE